MNYLAHARLSFRQPEILVGNMISDFVKGRRKFGYPAGIQQGITLHRVIDRFTDTHPATARAKSYFRPAYGLYSAAFVDVVYDHFLALDEAEFREEGLNMFSRETYDILGRHEEYFPESFALMFPHMKKHDWLYHYQYPEGIARSFRGLVHRAAYLKESDTAFQVFQDEYENLKQSYQAFFPAVKEMAWETLSELRQQ